MDEQLEKLQALNDRFDLSQFYSITLRPYSNEISLQGYYKVINFRIADALEVELKYENGMLYGSNEYYRITLTT